MPKASARGRPAPARPCPPAGPWPGRPSTAGGIWRSGAPTLGARRLAIREVGPAPLTAAALPHTPARAGGRLHRRSRGHPQAGDSFRRRRPWSGTIAAWERAEVRDRQEVGHVSPGPCPAGRVAVRGVRPAAGGSRRTPGGGGPRGGSRPRARFGPIVDLLRHGPSGRAVRTHLPRRPGRSSTASGWAAGRRISSAILSRTYRRFGRKEAPVPLAQRGPSARWPKRRSRPAEERSAERPEDNTARRRGGHRPHNSRSASSQKHAPSPTGRPAASHFR
jgi:hypothetical protein